MHELIDNEPSSFKPVVENEPTGPRHLTGSQAAALTKLSNLIQLQGQTERAGVLPRTKPLLIGPSGAGKTAVVRRLADLEKIPLLAVNCGSWIVFGAYTTPHTLTIIRRFVRDNPRGCVMLDEVDKVCPSSTGGYMNVWSLSVFTEVISFLDADSKLSGCGWTSAEIEKLRTAFFVCGAGAWQVRAAVARKQGGDYADAVRLDTGIPEEIFFRFNARILEIASPTAKDFQGALRRIHAELSLPPLDAQQEARLVESAVASNHGMRWIEQFLADVLIATPQARSQPSAPEKPAVEKLRISRCDFEQRLQKGIDLMENMQLLLSNFRVRLNLAKLICEQRGKDPGEIHLEPEVFAELLRNLADFGPALTFGTAISQAERYRRETELSVHGHTLLKSVGEWIEKRPFALKSYDLLESAIKLETGVRRLIALWRYLAGVEVSD
jgi:hypothetical protein